MLRDREHGYDLALERDALTRDHPCVEATCLRCRHHVRRRIDRDDCGADRPDLLGQHPVATAQIEDALARLRIEQLDHGRAKCRHKMSRRGITLGRPMLLRQFRHSQPFAVSAWWRKADRVVRVVIISGSMRNSITAGRPDATASSNAGANSSVRATTPPNPP